MSTPRVVLVRPATSPGKVLLVRSSRQPGKVTLVRKGGPPGLTGPQGDGGSYLHVQTAAASVWTVQHNLGFHPNFDVWTEDDNLYLGYAVSYLSNNVSLLTFPSPLAGTAQAS